MSYFYTNFYHVNSADLSAAMVHLCGTSPSSTEYIANGAGTGIGIADTTAFNTNVISKG